MALPTLMDLARRTDPDGSVAKIVEILAQSNEILSDMGFKEGNLKTGERTTIRTGLPTATWRKLNYGVQPTKSTTKQVDVACGMLEAYAEVDKKLAQLSNDVNAFRLSEAVAHLMGMNNQMATALFYGDSSIDEEQIMGLSPMFNTKSSDRNLSGYNIVDAGGTSDGDNTSIWLVVWGDQTVYGVYPQGSKAGLSHEDLGEVTLLDAASGRFQGYRSHFVWDMGLCVKNWRGVARIPSIDVAELTVDANTGANLIDLMIQAEEKVRPVMNLGKAAWYCNSTITSWLRRQIVEKTTSQLRFDDVAGKPVMMFGNAPVRLCDAILNTEDDV